MAEMFEHIVELLGGSVSTGTYCVYYDDMLIKKFDDDKKAEDFARLFNQGKVKIKLERDENE